MNLKLCSPYSQWCKSECEQSTNISYRQPCQCGEIDIIFCGVVSARLDVIFSRFIAVSRSLLFKRHVSTSHRGGGGLCTLLLGSMNIHALRKLTELHLTEYGNIRRGILISSALVSLGLSGSECIWAAGSKMTACQGTIEYK